MIPLMGGGGGWVSEIRRRAKRPSAASLLAGEVIYAHRILEKGIITRDHGDTRIGDEVFFLVFFRVVADHRPFGDVDVAVDDSTADAAMAAHIDVRKNNARLHL